MNNRAGIVSMLHNGEFKGVLNALNVDQALSSSLLHEIAQCEALNLALKEKKQEAINVMSMVLPALDDSCVIREKSTGKTAFLVAILNDHREIAVRMFNYLGNKGDNTKLREMCGTPDNNKTTPLHAAIATANPELIEMILGIDDAQKRLYFMRDGNGLFSLALAVKHYIDNPTELTISIINQLYFSLPKGVMRTRAVEQKVNLGWGLSKKPIWQYALRLCGKRAGNKVVSIDLNLADLINQVCNDGLKVWDFDVTLELIFSCSDRFGNTPEKMLRDAFKTLEHGLPGRTLGQTAQNASLVKRQEFMQRAKLANGGFWLAKVAHNPEVESHLQNLEADRDNILLFDGRLYYVPKQIEEAPRVCCEIRYHDLTERNQEYFKKLVAMMSDLPLSKKAEDDELKYALALVPLMKSTKTTDIPMESIHARAVRGVGATLFSGAGRKTVEQPKVTQTISNNNSNN